jgi:hypothetical protein
MFSGAVPVGGEHAEHLKMAACLIFKRPLKVIFKPPAENARTQGKPPFSHIHGHFRGPATKEVKAKIESRRSPSNEAPSVVSHKVASRLPASRSLLRRSSSNRVTVAIVPGVTAENQRN